MAGVMIMPTWDDEEANKELQEYAADFNKNYFKRSRFHNLKKVFKKDSEEYKKLEILEKKPF